MSKRKAFNFYLSYFETAMMLNNVDRLQFYDALMQKQFNGIDPVGLKGGVNFAWVSQKHSIDSQVEGWENKTKLSLQDTDNQISKGCSVGGSVGGSLPPTAQEKEKEKEKEKEEILPATRRVNLFSDLFTAWFKEKFELSYSMKTKDYVGLATIEKYCKENAKGEPIEMFKFILENYDALPGFYQTNINPSFIASRISEIASMLKKQHTKTQIVKQFENGPVNRKWFPSPSQYYSECISKKQEPFNFWTGNEMTEEEKISEYKIHKVGDYRYA